MLQKETLDHQEYAKFLAANFTVWQSLTTSLQTAATDALPGSGLFAAVDHLTADLTTLGRKVTAGKVPIPQLAGKPEVFGTAYVLYGSTLGAKYIYQVLSKKLGAAGEPMLNFYRFCANQSSGFWPEFQTALNENVVTPEDRQRAETAANGVFAAFAEAYRRQGGK